MQYPGKGVGMSEAQEILITDEIRVLIGCSRAVLG